jgi:hypothetical protein
MSTFADRAAILAISPRRYESITLPVSGLQIRYRSLSEAEMSAYDNAIFRRNVDTNEIEIDEDAERTMRARLIVLAVCDDDGNRLLTDADVPQVASLDAADILPLYEAINAHCGRKAAIERQKDLKKN